MAVLEADSGWVTNPNPTGDALRYPYGYVHPYLVNLNAQLTWATTELAIGFYGWRDGSLTELHFPDGSSLRLNPTLNAGTVALQFYYAQFLNRPAWCCGRMPVWCCSIWMAMAAKPPAGTFCICTSRPRTGCQPGNSSSAASRSAIRRARADGPPVRTCISRANTTASGSRLTARC